MHEPKRSFDSAVGTIISLYGTHVSSKNILGYCRENNVSVPYVVRQHRVSRGIYDLEPLLKQAQNPGIRDLNVPVGLNSAMAIDTKPELTEEQLEDDINSRFASLDMMAYGIVNGDYRSLIVSGNPGTGKTYTLETILENEAKSSKIYYTGVRGYVRATGLFRLMWDHKDKESVLLMDDADSIFQDEISLNLLKAGLDTTKRRHISWRSEKVFEAEDGEDIPQQFDFHGAIVFVSNVDFQREIQRGNKISPHLAALMSRSYYLDLNLLSTRELIVRIKSVVHNSTILTGMGISRKDQDLILAYIIENQSKIRELSLRTVTKMGTIWKASQGDMKRFSMMSAATCMIRGK